MKLLSYIESLSEAEQDDYAVRAGTTGKYLRAHIKYARKIARPVLIDGLCSASKGKVSRKEVLNHFYAEENPRANTAA